ncbi:hypothetical protein B0H14DRAFT_788984 [Mycena olivaceomarginata]|nr:hypothetical protein B0H14DRAFT_788984 [Mycena olivaceomarginata]
MRNPCRSRPLRLHLPPTSRSPYFCPPQPPPLPCARPRMRMRILFRLDLVQPMAMFRQLITFQPVVHHRVLPAVWFSVGPVEVARTQGAGTTLTRLQTKDKGRYCSPCPPVRQQRSKVFRKNLDPCLCTTNRRFSFSPRSTSTSLLLSIHTIQYLIRILYCTFLLYLLLTFT